VKKGFTLTEVVVVIGIILVLSAIGFSLAAPIRIKALESKSASQMKTIYQGVMLYSADTGSEGAIPGIDNIPIGFGNWPYVVQPYGVRREDFFSPLEPRSENPNQFSTYMLPIVGLTSVILKPEEYGFLTPELDRFKVLGSRYPIMIDTNFDFHHYWPSERDSDPFMLRRYEMWLSLSGSVSSVRVPGIRNSKAFKTSSN
jgi:prepilin-type N-terminal cleavage/methylation domain-containing protein